MFFIFTFLSIPKLELKKYISKIVKFTFQISLIFITDFVTGTLNSREHRKCTIVYKSRAFINITANNFKIFFYNFEFGLCIATSSHICKYSQIYKF